MKTPKRIQNGLLAPAVLCTTATAQAVDYKWTQTTSGTYDWSTTSNWLGGNAPDGPSTHSDSIFFLDGLTLADGVSITANNNLANPILTQDLRLLGTGPATGSATINLTGSAIKIGGTGDRFLRLTASNGAAGSLTYNIYNDIQGTHVIQFGGGSDNGTATFNFYGQITPRLDSTGNNGVLKQGLSTIRFHSSQSFNNREFNHVAGTVELVGGVNLTSSLRFLLRDSTLAISGGNSTVNVLENNAGVGTLQVANGRVLDVTTASATGSLANTDANRIRVTGGGTFRATHATTAANFTAPLQLEGSALELTRNNNWISTQSIYMQDGASLLTEGFDNTFDRLELRGGESFIDFGLASADSFISFGDISSSAWTAGSTLTLLNWQGFVLPTISDLGPEYLRFAGLTAGQLAQIGFLNPAGFDPGYYAADRVDVGGFAYIVPIPEPSTLLLALLGLAVVCFRRSRVQVRS